MKKRYTEEQIIGFLREADAGVPIVACRCRVRLVPGLLANPIRGLNYSVWL